MESNQSDPKWLPSDILQGNERIVSFANVVIDRERDITVGVLSALNFTRVAFGIERSSSPDFFNTIESLSTKKAIEESLSICHEWSDGFQLEVEDIYHVPLFERSLKSVSTKYGRPTPDWLTAVLQELQTANSSAAIVITRSPEVVVCMRLLGIPGPDVFVIFNPRPATDQQKAATLTFNTSLAQTVKRLRSILPEEKYHLAQDDLNWQAVLLSNCSGHIFVPRAISFDARASEDSFIMSSLAVLSLRAELSELKLENRTLATQNRLLEQNIIKFERDLQEEKIKLMYGPYSKLASSSTGKAPLRGFGDPSTSRLTAKIHEIDHDLELARRLQATFDAEDAQLSGQMVQLQRTAQRQYHCGICLDDFPEDDVVHIESCGHDLCRVCAHGHVCAKIDEHRFPVLCPVCTADQGNSNPGIISGLLVQLLGISEEQYGIWEEMEMTQFSTLVNCRKCQNSAFVDKDDLEAADEMRCPVLGCDHVWCRKCQQSIDPGGPKHSCDGASELDHLMKEQGWKYCPNCKTPIQKQDGCNHMSCISPGCNTQFCYRCGETVTRTAIAREIQQGKTEHFRKCPPY
ncbi:hypothetical protein BS17DRAFT_359651 [Gyrodon lividus]|nr:hypothetical protein BS17DRAFT_359651 [Gyrodon lividus]